MFRSSTNHHHAKIIDRIIMVAVFPSERTKLKKPVEFFLRTLNIHHSRLNKQASLRSPASTFQIQTPNVAPVIINMCFILGLFI